MTATTDEPIGAEPAAEREPAPSEPWPSATPAGLVRLPVQVPLQAPLPAPVPVLAPYLGLVASVLCALGGGWLLLAPYALDLRHGAARLPRSAAVELETGAAIVAVALACAILFSAALFSRLRTHPDAGLTAEPEPEPASEFGPEAEPEPAESAQAGEPAQSPADAPTESAAEPHAGFGPAGASSALREMLTPLVAALAADLRSQDRERGEQRRREEP